MRKIKNAPTPFRKDNPHPFVLFTLIAGLLCCICGNALGHPFSGGGDTAVEKKVDYLEQIYFSGGNKAELNTRILISLQAIEGKAPTRSLAKQVTFLIDIKDKAGDAENACEVLDLIAVGIYNIDAAEAVQQGVKMPSDKAKAKAGDAIENLYKLNSTAYNLSSGASNLAWSSYLLSGGRYGGFAAGAGRVAGTASAIGGVAGVAGQTAQTGRQIGEIGKSLGLLKKKDKSCNDVAKKDIEIGEHTPLFMAEAKVVVKVDSFKAVEPNMSKILITGADFTKLSSIQDRLKSIAIVSAVKMDFDINGSSFNVTHSGSCQDLLAQMLGACKGILSEKNITSLKPDERKISFKL